MTDIVERARLVQRVNAHWLDSICDCDECTEERFDLITPMADEIEALRARVKELEAERDTLQAMVDEFGVEYCAIPNCTHCPVVNDARQVLEVTK